MICKYCKREHNEDELCKPTRRSFFFLGLGTLAAIAVGKVDLSPSEFVWNKTRIDFISEVDIVAAELDRIIPHMKNLFESNNLFFSVLKNKVEYIELS